MTVHILTGDCRDILPTLTAGSVQMCVTSPPYFGLRDYGQINQIGMEQTVDAYVSELVDVFGGVRRALADDGTLWINLGDSYGAGKNMLGVPWRVAFALQEDGWVLRSDIIWHKPNPMPESVRDRPTKSHEYIFLMAKSKRYYYDADAISEPITPLTVQRISQSNLPNQKGSDRVPGKTNGRMKAVVRKQDALGKATYTGFNDGYFGGKAPIVRNKRTVWTVTTKPFKEAHFATYPPDLIEPCVKAGSRPGDTVLDPFGGAGTTGLVADRLGRNAVLMELNPDYAEIARLRISQDNPMFAEIVS